MFNVKKEMKKMQIQQEAQEQLNALLLTEKSIDKMIDEFYADARERLLENDSAGFELIANSIFYFQDIKRVVQTIRIQYQTYVKTAQFMDTIDGIRPVLRRAADMMNAMPSVDQQNKDFMRLKKGLMRGQLNMKAMSSMMTSVNPAVITSRDKSDLDNLKEYLLMGSGSTVHNNLSAGMMPTPRPTSSNEDFFPTLNRD